MMFEEDLRDYLIEKNIGFSSSDLFVSGLPETPINASAIINNGGDVMTAHDSLKIQLLIRNTGYSNGASLVKEVKNLFRYNYDFMMKNTYIKKTGVIGAPIHLGRDERDAHIWSINLVFFIRGV